MKASFPDRTPNAMASDSGRLERLFGRSDLLPLWVAEPYVELATPIIDALGSRASVGWYGYEVRPKQATAAFWDWVDRRHGWVRGSLDASVSPSVGTSIGALIEILTGPGDGVIIQPPVFTDFKPLIRSAGRSVVPNPIVNDGGRYVMDLDGLRDAAAEPSTNLMVLCNPHNPVGRAWSSDELAQVAEICAANDVFVVADEIHSDLAVPPSRFIPFAVAAEGSGVRFAATHGPIKTFGLAGVCDSLLVSNDGETTSAFRAMSSRLHLTRNNVFGIAAIEAAYSDGDEWLDGFIELIAANVASLRSDLPKEIILVEPEATYLAWLDFRALGIDVPDLVPWLAEAGIALSPGHWFGRQGAGYARMTVAVPEAMMALAIARLNEACS